MSKKANPALVGAFVLGAVALALTGIIVFGGGSFFEKKVTCVLYFDESIAGLDIGAPVEFQGVRIGTVSDIQIVLDDIEDGVIKRPVTIQLEERRFHYSCPLDRMAPRDEEDLETGMEHLVTERGLRARLALQSMLTGKLKVECGYFPKTPDTRKEKKVGQVWVLPTIPTPMHNLGKEIEELPLKAIVHETHSAIKGVAELVSSLASSGAISNLNATLQSTDILMTKINEDITPLMGESRDTLESVRVTLDDLQALLQKIESDIEPFLVSLTETSEKAGQAMDEQSPLRNEILQTMRELTKAARSVRYLTDYLEQHPEALLRGKQ
ncbi:MAG: MCE family protein [Spartobacteria bacterium]|nr:MCE family protein [Spartobacteria bacterium]